MDSIPNDSINFLKKLAANNNRDWFAENKAEYIEQHEHMISFADSMLAKMNEHDTIETVSGKKSLYRIYRDVRFSKDKSPYKSNWSGGFMRATKARRGSYYFHIQPGNKSFAGGGFWGPNKEDLQRVREDIATDATELRSILTSPELIETFGGIAGDQLKTSPKGFDKEHPDVDLLRFKQFILTKSFTDKEVLSPDFAEKLNATFKKMRPFFDYMSDVLTTDTNGTPL
ncbi:MAG: hypothetical protein ACI837_000280 [Crocinitomicaceae bacterium]|jgi:uncharacterized protein (TIGR02453 family)